MLYKGVKRSLTQLTYPEIKSKSFSFGGSVAAGSYVIYDITPPEGEIWEVQDISLYCGAPPSATTGNHKISFIRPISGNLPALAAFLYNVNMTFRGCWPVNPQYANPDVSSYVEYFRGLLISHDLPLRLRYDNNTDVEQTNAVVGALIYRVWKER